MDPADLMRRAIDAARRGIAAGNSPFGCAIAVEDRVIAAAHNTVASDVDITAHAEINALRASCQIVGELHLEGAVVATTCEPCPMCAAALHWARVAHVYCGAGIADAAQAGFNELSVSAARLLKDGRSSVKLTKGVLADECRELFAQWLARSDRQAY